MDDKLPRAAEDVLETAADWVDRLEDLSFAERRQLAAWLEESGEHAQAFARMARLMGDPSLFDTLERVCAPAQASPPLSQSRQERRAAPGHGFGPATKSRGFAPLLHRRQALAAGLATTLALPVAAYLLLDRDKLSSQGTSRLRLASAIGKPQRFTLPDGSGLLLDASSQAAVEFTSARRVITLERGACRFDVQHDADRPFEVCTRHASMVALGTSFSVDYFSDGSELKVFTGRVGLNDRSGGHRVLVAMQWASVSDAAVVTIGRFDPAADRDWQDDWLDARSMRLGHAIERLARYSPVPLRLADRTLAPATFSGRFRLNTPEQSLELIGALFGLELDRRPDAVYLIAPGGPRR